MYVYLLYNKQIVYVGLSEVACEYVFFSRSELKCQRVKLSLTTFSVFDQLDSKGNSHWRSENKSYGPYGGYCHFRSEFRRYCAVNNVQKQKQYRHQNDCSVINKSFVISTTSDLSGLRIALCRSIAIAVRVKMLTLTDSTWTNGQNGHITAGKFHRCNRAAWNLNSVRVLIIIRVVGKIRVRFSCQLINSKKKRKRLFNVHNDNVYLLYKDIKRCNNGTDDYIYYHAEDGVNRIRCNTNIVDIHLLETVLKKDR